MKKNNWLFLLVFTLCGLMGPHALAAQEGAKLVIKVATLAPKGSTMMKLIEKMRQEIKTKTDNEVDFKIYYGGVQGDAMDVLRKIRFHQLHGATLSGYGLGHIFPEVRVTSLPYIFRNYEEVAYVRSKLEDYMNRAFEERGYVILGWYDVGFVYTYSKVPITTLEIARKQKFWVPENDPMGAKIFEVLEISPVSLSITDVLTSLSTRLIDAASGPPLAAVGFHWYTKFKYMSEYPSTNVLGAFLVTQKIWKKITPQSQEIIRDVSRRYCTEIQQAMYASNKKSIELLKKSGISIVRVDDANEWNDFVQQTAYKTSEALVGELYPRELLERTMSLLREYREMHPDSAIERID